MSLEVNVTAMPGFMIPLAKFLAPYALEDGDYKVGRSHYSQFEGVTDVIHEIIRKFKLKATFDGCITDDADSDYVVLGPLTVRTLKDDQWYDTVAVGPSVRLDQKLLTDVGALKKRLQKYLKTLKPEHRFKLECGIWMCSEPDA